MSGSLTEPAAAEAAPRISPEDVLAATAELLTGTGAVGPGRARTAVRLLRYAVEAAADRYWEAIRPGEVAGRAGRGQQLRLLAATMDKTTAHDVYAAWCRLSHAAKPHPYELAPTAAELRALTAAAVRAVSALIVDTDR